ncbi:MAG: nucleotide pyrophosphohydrolase [bacterium]
MDTKEIQRQVDKWISQFAEGYWEPLTSLAVLTEEVGELAREINHKFGQKPKKSSEPESSLSLELGDIIFVLAAFANAHNLDLGEAFAQAMAKNWSRDKERWTLKESK